MTEYVKQTVSKALLSKNNLNTVFFRQTKCLVGGYSACFKRNLLTKACSADQATAICLQQKTA